MRLPGGLERRLDLRMSLVAFAQQQRHLALPPQLVDLRGSNGGARASRPAAPCGEGREGAGTAALSPGRRAVGNAACGSVSACSSSPPTKSSGRVPTRAHAARVGVTRRGGLGCGRGVGSRGPRTLHPVGGRVNVKVAGALRVERPDPLAVLVFRGRRGLLAVACGLHYGRRTLRP